MKSACRIFLSSLVFGCAVSACSGVVAAGSHRAQPGANIDTFYSGRWTTLINNVKAGDYVFAAFGINDSGTTHGPVAPAAFQTQMGVMADEVAAKKATFIPTTSSPLQVWVAGKETNTRLQPYCDATIAVGMTKGLLVDDLNARGVDYYNMIGQTAAAALTRRSWCESTARWRHT